MSYISGLFKKITTEIRSDPYLIFSENDLRLRLCQLIKKHSGDNLIYSEMSNKDIGITSASPRSRYDIVIISKETNKITDIVELKVFWQSSANELFNRVEKDRVRFDTIRADKTINKHIIALHLGRSNISVARYNEMVTKMKNSHIHFLYDYINTRVLMEKIKHKDNNHEVPDVGGAITVALQKIKDSPNLIHSENDITQLIYEEISKIVIHQKIYAEWAIKLSHKNTNRRANQLRFDLVTCHNNKIHFNGGSNLNVAEFSSIIEIKFHQKGNSTKYAEDLRSDIIKLTHPEIPLTLEKFVVGLNLGNPLDSIQKENLQNVVDTHKITLILCEVSSVRHSKNKLVKISPS